MSLKVNVRKIIVTILIVLLIASNVFTLKLYLDANTIKEDELISETGDELSRTKFFIKDWYDELEESYGNVQIYNNELQFLGGTYTLTVNGDRIRAVYPRGERYFQLEIVTYVEFYTQDGHLSCRMHYNQTGELTFKLN